MICVTCEGAFQEIALMGIIFGDTAELVLMILHHGRRADLGLESVSYGLCVDSATVETIGLL